MRRNSSLACLSGKAFYLTIILHELRRSFDLKTHLQLWELPMIEFAAKVSLIERDQYPLRIRVSVSLPFAVSRVLFLINFKASKSLPSQWDSPTTQG